MGRGYGGYTDYGQDISSTDEADDGWIDGWKWQKKIGNLEHFIYEHLKMMFWR